MTAPDWLKLHDGTLKAGIQPNCVFVMIGGVPQYQVESRPAAGKFAAAVQQSNNGHRHDDGQRIYATAEAALAGGLEQLRAVLGW